jgi:hypothetical protein
VAVSACITSRTRASRLLRRRIAYGLHASSSQAKATCQEEAGNLAATEAPVRLCPQLIPRDALSRFAFAIDRDAGDDETDSADLGGSRDLRARRTALVW